MISLSQEGAAPLRLTTRPKRIVSLVPSITENLFLFGYAPVGRTSFCIEPKDAVKAIPTVGGTKNIKIQKLLELKPDLVIANKEENTKSDVEALIESGVKVWLTYPLTVKGGIELMEELADLVGRTPAISKQVEAVRNEFQKSHSSKHAGRSVITLIWKEPWIAVGGNNFMNDMVKVAGGINPFEKKPSRYPETSEDEIVRLKPDLLILPSEPYAFEEKDLMEWKRRFEKVGINTKASLFSGEDLCWFGPRIERGLQNLRTLISAV